MPELDLHEHCEMTFDEDGKVFNGQGEVFSTIGAGTIRSPGAKSTNPDTELAPYTAIHTKHKCQCTLKVSKISRRKKLEKVYGT